MMQVWNYYRFFLPSLHLIVQSSNKPWTSKYRCSKNARQFFVGTRLISLSKSFIIIRHHCSRMSVLNLCECFRLSSNQLLTSQSKLFSEKTTFDRHCFTSKEDQSRYFSFRIFFFYQMKIFIGKYISRYRKDLRKYISRYRKDFQKYILFGNKVLITA